MNKSCPSFQNGNSSYLRLMMKYIVHSKRLVLYFFLWSLSFSKYFLSSHNPIKTRQSWTLNRPESKIIKPKPDPKPERKDNDIFLWNGGKIIYVFFLLTSIICYEENEYSFISIYIKMYLVFSFKLKMLDFFWKIECIQNRPT